MTNYDLSAAQWRALNNMHHGFPPLAQNDIIDQLRRRGLIERSGGQWAMTRDGRAAHALDRRTE